MIRFKGIAHIVLISSLLLSYPLVGNSQERTPVTYRAEFKPLGDGRTWNQAIPPGGGALGLDFALVFSPGTVTAEVAGEIHFYEGNRTVSVRGTGGHLSSDGGVVLTGNIVMDFTIPLPEAFFEEDDDVHIKHSVPIPGFPNINKGWNESVQFDSFLLSGGSVQLDVGIPELVTMQLSAVKIVPVVASAILSGGTATAAVKILAESLSDYLDAGIRLNGGMMSELTLAGKAVTVNGTPITVEGPPIRAPGFDPTEETYRIQSSYDEEFTYTLEFVASGSTYARVAVLLGIEIWSYNNQFAEKRIPIIPKSPFDLNFGGAATSAMLAPPGIRSPVGGGGLIPDRNLADAVRDALKIPRYEPITRNDMLRLTHLDAGHSGIRSLTGLEHAANLTSLSLRGNPISKLSLSGLTSLTSLDLGSGNALSKLSLSGLTSLTRLHLWGNGLSEVSLSNLPSLTSLNLWGNGLSEVSLSNLPSLTSLNLSDNGLSEVSLSNLPSLTSLNLSDNGLSEVSLSGLTSLTSLSLRGNPISKLSLSGLTSLTSLNLSDNGLSEVSLSGLTSLTSLDLSDNGLSEVSLSGLTSLTRLYLSDNAISDVSPLSGLTNLTYLGLSDNAISDVSPLSGLTNLTFLRLWGNAISDVSPLSGLTNLTRLYLSGNAISDVSPLSGLTNLTSLSLGGNAISDVSPLSGLTNLTSLNLLGNPISDVSPLSGLTNLTSLNLLGNPISELSLSGLTSLTYLGLGSGNALSKLSLSGLTSLTYLDLGSGNALSKLSLSGLTSLTYLGLGSGKALSELSLSNLPSLTYLGLGSGKALSKLSLSGLTSLTYLGLGSGKALSKLSLSGLTSLTYLDLRGNAISDVSLSGLTNLTYLDLGGNPLPDVSSLAKLPNLRHLILLDDYDLLNDASRHTHIPAMQARGVSVEFASAPAYTNPTLVKFSGDDQIGTPGAALPTPFVVQALDVGDKPISGVSIRFAVYQGRGTLRPTAAATDTATTDTDGEAQTILTLGPNPGPNKVAAIADGFEPVSFTATAREPDQITEDANEDAVPPEQIPEGVREWLSPLTATTDATGEARTTLMLGPDSGTNRVSAIAEDVNGDGLVNILDLVLVGSNFGQIDSTTGDVNGDGLVNIADLVLVSGAISDAAAAPAAGSEGER